MPWYKAHTYCTRATTSILTFRIFSFSLRLELGKLCSFSDCILTWMGESARCVVGLVSEYGNTPIDHRCLSLAVIMYFYYEKPLILSVHGYTENQFIDVYCGIVPWHHDTKKGCHQTNNVSFWSRCTPSMHNPPAPTSTNLTHLRRCKTPNEQPV